ncbi:TetR/AcrR family transcriptional regulator [Lysinibacillus boronitolerans]|uniref:TetR/AcrR family transcriptional regulator n=1 Tax=Lysinibacillus boronitolerans TaxID=309788 RepID=UPI0021614F02|nr:TetR/AcrR family transcriptional regulator [Lysinibacillus boronitolerans]MCS1390310.1 TetR/AcrR family transcriptional regulator [Lysinibacillus boronitolerans]
MTNRKMEIIELTLKNIQEKGFTSFSYEHLAKELGVTKASIHYHFEKKGDLGIAVCERIQQGLERTFTLIKESTMPAEEKPFAFIMQRIKFLEQDGICPISALQADYQELPQPMQDKLQQLSQMEIDVFVELLKEAKQQGTLQATNDLEALAILLISSTKGALQYKRVVGEAFFLKMLEQLKELLK